MSVMEIYHEPRSGASL